MFRTLYHIVEVRSYVKVCIFSENIPTFGNCFHFFPFDLFYFEKCVKTRKQVCCCFCWAFKLETPPCSGIQYPRGGQGQDGAKIFVGMKPTKILVSPAVASCNHIIEFSHKLDYFCHTIRIISVFVYKNYYK